jgi:hypothetical protein
MSIALDMTRHRAPVVDENFRTEYLQALRLIERLHRLLLDVIKDEFDRTGGAVDMGYIHYKRSETDRRSVRVSLTQKGHDACAVVKKLYQRQLTSVEAVAQVSGDEFHSLNKALVRLERYWTDQIRYRL